MDNIEKIKSNSKKGKAKELIKNTIIIFIGKISTQFISFLLLPLYTSYIDTGEYGYVDLVTTYTTLIVTVVIVQLDMAAFRFLLDYRDSEDGKKKVISNIFFCIIVLTAIFTLVYIFLAKFVLKIQYAWLILLIILTNIISSVLLQIARGLGKNLDFSVSSIISGIITIILNIVLIIKFRLGELGLLISIIFSSLSSSLYLIIRLKILKKIKLGYRDKRMAKELFKYSVPLVPNQLSLWIVSISDRTIISTILGTSANGIYSIANKFSVILNGIYNVFYLAWSEQASLNFKEDDRDNYFSLVINNGIKIFGTICLLIITAMPFIFSILINQNYEESYYQIPILLLGTLLSIIVGMIGVIYIAKKKSKELAKTTAIAAIINIIINIVFIRQFGLYAASMSTFIAYLIVMIYRWFDIKKYINIKLDKVKIFVIIVSLIIALCFYYINILTINIISLTLSILIAIYLNKNIIVLIIEKGAKFAKIKK